MSSKPRAPRKKTVTAAPVITVTPIVPVVTPVVTVTPVEPTVEPTVETVTPVPVAKKAKKPVKVVAVVTPDGIEGTFLTEPRRPLIAHLRIKASDIAFHDNEFTYNPNPPTDMNVEPYDAGAANMFSAGQELLESGPVTPPVQKHAQPLETPSAPAVTSVSALPCFYKADLMVQFRDSQEAKKLPPTTDIACFWCAHSFENTSCVIPEREIGGTYQVYGNFCCPECAVGYLLTESLDPHVRWERMALLHRVYDHDGTGRIFPAPPRETLQLFGGPMSIETYRATVRGGKVRVDMHMPPMVSILGHIDTKPIDFFDTSLKNTGIQLPMDKATKAEEGLRLKRTKPLKDKESTLDTVMNIQIGRR